MNSKRNLVSIALGSSLAIASMGAVAATDNPFSATSLSSGYQVASSHGKGSEGSCGAKDDKKGEGSCGGK